MGEVAYRSEVRVERVKGPLRRAFLPAEKVRAAYEEAVRLRYLWHEFGDLNLIV